MRWTGASERAVKFWLARRAGPNGQHLVDLARYSDRVFEAFLDLSHRNIPTSHPDQVRRRLRIIAKLAQGMLEDH
jgi:hypothetical protein